MKSSQWAEARVGIAGMAACLLLVAQSSAASPRPLPAPAIIVTAPSHPASPDLFGTVAMAIKAERFSESWRRARIDASWLPAMQTLIAPARGLFPEAQIEFIQSAVHRRVRWISDATQWGHHDYWASAVETLSVGAGDMEDRAIVKMEALRALGFSPRDLFLTMGRDRVGGPITVLIVRSGKRYFVLDDTGGTPVATDRREGFEPMITLGANTAWLHGRRASQSAAIRASK